MKSVQRTRKNGAASQKKFKASSSDMPQQALEVSCRIRPLKLATELIALQPISECELQICHQGPSYGQVYKFKDVFTEKSLQHEVFKNVSFPLVKGLLAGQNGLLFTYGVTSAGKTFTVTGGPSNPGILPRTLDTLFNTLDRHNLQSRIFSFKPDSQNGFEIVNGGDRLLRELQNEIADGMAKKAKVRKVNSLINDWQDRLREDNLWVEDVNCDNHYAVFVSYVEIYNNYIYDLLDDSTEPVRGTPQQQPQSKMLRECNNRAFVQGLVEMEVNSADEAFDLFLKGVSRRRIGSTSLNSESSRSHSVFTIRVAQAQKNFLSQMEDMPNVHVSQLSIVDLAGCERAARTNANQNRLREAANINNSLMQLRICFDVLRNNQKLNSNAAPKMVPYRDNKLTQLFKSYFEGDGAVKMILCLNPGAEEIDETIQVLKFGEQSQEIVTPKGRGATVRANLNLTFSDLAAGGMVDFEPFPTQMFDGDINDWSDDDSLMAQWEECCKKRREATQKVTDYYMYQAESIRPALAQHDNQLGLLRDENVRLRQDLDARNLQIEQLKAIYDKNELKLRSYDGQQEDLMENNRELQEKIEVIDDNIEKMNAEMEEIQNVVHEHLTKEKDRLKQWCIDVLRLKQMELEKTKCIQQDKINLVNSILTDDNFNFNFNMPSRPQAIAREPGGNTFVKSILETYEHRIATSTSPQQAPTINGRFTAAGATQAKPSNLAAKSGSKSKLAFKNQK